MSQTPTRKEDVPPPGAEPRLREDSSDDADEVAAPVYPSQKLGAVTRKKNECLKYMKTKNPENIEKVKELLNQYKVKIENFYSACTVQLQRTDILSESRTEFYSWYKPHLKTMHDFQDCVENWLFGSESENTQVDMREKMRHTPNSAFQTGGDLSDQLGDFKVLHDWEAESVSGDLQAGAAADAGNVGKGSKEDEFLEVLKEQNRITMLLAQNQIRSTALGDPEIFDGSEPTDYKSFILSFDRTVLRRTSDYGDLYYNLIKYTRGEAQQLVKSCNYENPETAYQKARQMLEETYGNEIVIASHYITKLKEWKNIDNENPTALHDLSIFLKRCQALMGTMDSLNQLNSLKEISDIAKKLPTDLRRKFRDIAGNIVQSGQRVMFSHLVDFVTKRAQILRLPLIGDIVSDKNRPREKKSFHVSTGTSRGRTQVACPCCKKENHFLDDCFFFRKKAIDQREEFIRQNNICFGCLRSTSHFSSKCKNKLKCKICKKMHPTSLHKTVSRGGQNVLQVEPEVSSSEVLENVSSHHIDTNMQQKKLVYPAVLVDLRVKGSKKTVRTYLGMDTFCTDVFIDDELVRYLNVDVEPTVLSLTTMHDNNTTVKYNRVRNLEILSLDGKTKTVIESAFSKTNWPFEIKDSPQQSEVMNHREFENLQINFENKKIGILVGLNRPDILRPTEIIHTSRRGPYATKHMFGWAINGPLTYGKTPGSLSCFNTMTEYRQNHDLNQKFNSVFKQDFDDIDETPSPSLEDKLWLNRVESSIKLVDSHLQINLPFTEDNIRMPNNYNQAKFRVEKLRHKFKNNGEYFKRYREFMDNMIDMNYAEQIPDHELETDEGKCWYLIHFGVEHKQKRKLRIVFDCSLKFNNASLNDKLMQGPDLINNLVGVILRFRQGKIAFMSDIKSMYYQVRVPTSDADFMRFLWFPNNDLQADVRQYRLLVHVFGAKSSPSIANYALQCVAKCVEMEVPQDVKDTILRNFYVDDILKSVDDEDQAIHLALSTTTLLQSFGFELTSFISNSKKLLNSLPSNKLSKGVETLNLSSEDLPAEKALGLIWNVNRDTIGFSISLEDRPFTKRGILSTLFSIYDPLFIASPAIMTGKKIFQELCEARIDWDEEIDDVVSRRWQRWLEQIVLLESYEIPRCFSSDISSVSSAQLHIFCDGSLIGYGAVAYLRLSNVSEAKSTIVMAKARLTPLSRTSLKTVPRIELNAAKVAVSLYQKLKKELDIVTEKTVFWSDSVVTLNYIKSETGRFQRFVANRVAFIRSETNPRQWCYVPTKLNPADLLSRGVVNVAEFCQNNIWKHGPKFLAMSEDLWPTQEKCFEVPVDDMEVKKDSTSHNTKTTTVTPTSRLIESTSKWNNLVRRVATMLRLRDGLKVGSWKNGPFIVEEINAAELAIWRYVQQTDMIDIHRKVTSGKLEKRHHLARFTPFVDKDDIVRVGGRIDNASVDYDKKHPIILPQKHPVVERYCLHLHRKIGHLGSENLLASLREHLYIIGGNALAKKVSRNCITCRKINRRPEEQLMANLPPDRLASDLPAFSNTGVDFFGPIYISRGRGKIKEKRYGVVLTCLSSRAIHIEVAYSLDVDSFINALRRFISRRGPVASIRSDNGTNFVAGEKEINNAIKEWNNSQINDWCIANQIKWQFNPPLAPHFGGVWEREIRTIKKVLMALTLECGNRIKLNDEILTTLMCEIENILNSRPLTAISNNPEDLEPLTPNHLLHLYSGVVFPPGLFDSSDLYHRRRWRQVQHFAEVFWNRWRREYLPILIHRQKWYTKRRSLEPGDLVLVMDQLLPRAMWCTGRVQEVMPDKHGLVRFARVKVARFKDGHHLHIGVHEFVRPISKLIILKTVDEL